jgi:hypothetical protein
LYKIQLFLTLPSGWCRIPLRGPNGMNRYGAILSDLGFDDFARR